MPTEIDTEQVTFRVNQENSLLLIDVAKPGATRRNLPLDDGELEALAPVTFPKGWQTPMINGEKVSAEVEFSADIPADRKHDRTAIFDHGDGRLRLEVEGRELTWDICPKLARQMEQISQN